MSQSVHDFHDDPRNAGIRIWINGALKPRAEAVVSVFDSGFVLGDGVWEGLRVSGGHPLFLDAHLDRAQLAGDAALLLERLAVGGLGALLLPVAHGEDGIEAEAETFHLSTSASRVKQSLRGLSSVGRCLRKASKFAA